VIERRKYRVRKAFLALREALAVAESKTEIAALGIESSQEDVPTAPRSFPSRASL